MDDSGFGVYFVTDSPKRRVRIPVNPSELTVSYPGDNTNYNVAGLGEIVIPRIPKLATVGIESFFPRNSFTTATVSNSWYKPSFYVAFFRMLQRSKVIFHFIINRFDSEDRMFDTSFNAVVSDFEITDKGGESGDIYYKISIQEYRSAEPKKLEIISVDSATDITKIAEVRQRTTPDDEIVAGDMITVTGPIYGSESQTEAQFAKVLNYMNQSRQVVSRVLPPDAQAQLHKVYIMNVGWVNKTDCVKGNVLNTSNRIGDLRDDDN